MRISPHELSKRRGAPPRFPARGRRPASRPAPGTRAARARPNQAAGDARSATIECRGTASSRQITLDLTAHARIPHRGNRRGAGCGRGRPWSGEPWPREQPRRQRRLRAVPMPAWTEVLLRQVPTGSAPALSARIRVQGRQMRSGSAAPSEMQAPVRIQQRQMRSASASSEMQVPVRVPAGQMRSDSASSSRTASRTARTGQREQAGCVTLTSPPQPDHASSEDCNRSNTRTTRSPD